MVLEKHFLNSLGKESFIIDNINSLKNTLKDKIKRKATENGANALIGVTFEISGIADILVISMTKRGCFSDSGWMSLERCA